MFSMTHASTLEGEPDANPSGARPWTCVQGPGECVTDWLIRDAAERETRQLEGLAELAAMGLSLAKTVHRRIEAAQAEGDEGPETSAAVANLGATYTRLARAVRQTWALENRIAEARRRRMLGLEAVRAEAAAAEASRRTTEQAGRTITALHIQSIVDELIDAEHEGDDEAFERLHALAEEHLIDARDEDDFRDRPTGEVVAAIAKAIGLNPDWDRWADEDWAEEDAEARAWGSPYGRGFKAWGRDETIEPLPPCGEGVGDGGVGSVDGEFAPDTLHRQRLTPNPGPSPQGGGESTGPP